MWNCHYEVVLQLDIPKSINMRGIIPPIVYVLNNTPNLSSATDATTCLSMLHMFCIAPLILFGFILLGILTK